MQKTKPIRSKRVQVYSLAFMTSLSMTNIERVIADDATTAPTPKKYTRAPMNASNAIMDDPLLGNNYERPTWNLHDSAGLPDWLTVGVEQRTRYDNISNTFKPNQSYGLSSAKINTKTAPAFTGQKISTNTVNYNPSPSTHIIGGAGIGGDQGIELQTDLWLQAQFGKFRFATEVMDSRDIGGDQTTLVTNNTVDTLDFTQVYVDWADKNAWNSNLGVEIKV